MLQLLKLSSKVLVDGANAHITYDLSFYGQVVPLGWSRCTYVSKLFIYILLTHLRQEVLYDWLESTLKRRDCCRKNIESFRLYVDCDLMLRPPHYPRSRSENRSVLTMSTGSPGPYDAMALECPSPDGGSSCESSRRGRGRLCRCTAKAISYFTESYKKDKSGVFQSGIVW